MPISNYGVWVGTPKDYKVEFDDDKPHLYLYFEDGEAPTRREAAINIKSGASDDSRLVFWMVPRFNHAIRPKLKALGKKWNPVDKTPGSATADLALDLLRTAPPLVQLASGSVVPHTVPGVRNDIVDFIEPFVQDCIRSAATVYVFGSRYSGTPEKGLHNVHMNQGSGGRFARDNGVRQDGGLVVEFPDGHFEAFFTAFASQAVKTDDKGDAIADAARLYEFLLEERDPTKVGSRPGPGPADPPKPRPPPTVGILSAMVNPVGADNVDNPESLLLINMTAEPVPLKGWTVANHQGRSQALPDDAELPGGGGQGTFQVPQVPFSNKGGSIILKDGTGVERDVVSYTAAEAKRAGVPLRFGRERSEAVPSS